MIVPDINLLLYAEIDAFPQHAAAARWWEEALNAPERRVGLPAPSLFGFIRLSTSRMIFEEPLRMKEAIGRVQRWFSRPNVDFLVPGTRHLELAFALLEQLGTGGNLTTDVQLAAYAIENNAELHSNDGDFTRFDGLRWRNPLRA